MGNAMGTAMGSAFGIYMPPKEKYPVRSVKVMKTVDGIQICMREFVPWEDLPLKEEVILFSHGNADDLRTCAAYCQWLADSLHMRVYAYDYVGYGLSGPGQPSEANMQLSVSAAASAVCLARRGSARGASS